MLVRAVILSACSTTQVVGCCTATCSAMLLGVCEYFGKKLGGYLLSEAIKNSFNQGAKRVWVHTCSLDHENALKNYLARGMKVFKTETLIR